jgi:hypothetical protein
MSYGYLVMACLMVILLRHPYGYLAKACPMVILLRHAPWLSF